MIRRRSFLISLAGMLGLVNAPIGASEAEAETPKMKAICRAGDKRQGQYVPTGEQLTGCPRRARRQSPRLLLGRHTETTS